MAVIYILVHSELSILPFEEVFDRLAEIVAHLFLKFRGRLVRDSEIRELPLDLVVTVDQQYLTQNKLNFLMQKLVMLMGTTSFVIGDSSNNFQKFNEFKLLHFHGLTAFFEIGCNRTFTKHRSLQNKPNIVGNRRHRILHEDFSDLVPADNMLVLFLGIFDHMCALPLAILEENLVQLMPVRFENVVALFSPELVVSEILPAVRRIVGLPNERKYFFEGFGGLNIRVLDNANPDEELDEFFSAKESWILVMVSLTVFLTALEILNCGQKRFLEVVGVYLRVDAADFGHVNAHGVQIDTLNLIGLCQSDYIGIF